MRKTIINKLLFPGLLILGFMQDARAQFEEGKPTVTVAPIIGNAILSGANTTTLYATEGATSRKIKNVITFKMDEDTTLYFNSSFNARVIFTVEAKVLAGGGSLPLWTDTLTIAYDKTALAKYNVRAYKVLPSEYESIKITVSSLTITGQSGWNPQPVLRLENEMRVLRYYTFSSNPAHLTPTINPKINYPDALGISWAWVDAANNNLTQLEWSWMETEMRGYYLNAGVFDLGKLFRENSTRIDLAYTKNNYKIPLLYDGTGKLFYRIRAAYRRQDGSIIAGPWSAIDSFAYSGHEPSLNWQSATSFAEGGLFQTVIQYYDGLLKNRQSVTKDNSTGNTLVGETIYDLQGRANVQIIPTPTIDTVIKFFNDFNRFQGQGQYDNPARYFDLSIGLGCIGAPRLDSNYGNGKYFSSNNSWLATETKSKLIPNALGYAYTETRYMDDASQRIRSQGGVGDSLQIGSGHETKYYYGKPSQPELDALFGTNAGDASHYSKNMVKDANGQMNVSYVDMAGRTIATALAGYATPGIDSLLSSPGDYPLAPGVVTNQLLTPATNIIRGNSIEAISTILVPITGNYDFTYKLTPDILRQFNCNSQQICFDCKYDLVISIKSEECGDTTPIIRRYSNLQAVPANQACDTAMGFVGEGISIQTKQINFSQMLSPGSWVIRKTLTINDSMFQVRRDSALKAFTCKTLQSLYDSVYAVLYATSGCGATGTTQACDSCLTNLGSYNIYKVKYLASIGNPSSYNEADIHTQYSQDSLDCVQACSLSPQLGTLAGYRTQLLTDMTPFTGQYALENIGNPNNLEGRYNIFTNSFYYYGNTFGKLYYYRTPVNESNQPSYYFTEDNQPDVMIYPAGTGDLSFLNNINKQDFTNLFQTSWAKSLIYYHPEFSKLKFAETTLNTSFTWLDNVLACNTYSAAVTLGAHNPMANDPYFVNNYVPLDVSTMQQYLTNYIGTQSSNPSIWQLANGVVLCAAVPESQRMACIMTKSKTGMDPSATTPAIQNKIWEQFKTMYLSYRSDMVMKYINSQPGVLSQADMNLLQSEGKQLVFVTMQGVANQNGWGQWWTNVSNGDTTGTGVYAGNNANNIDNCVGQRPFWRARLLQCEQFKQLLNNEVPADSTTVNTIINSILDGLVSVCNNSRDAQHPWGASNVRPGYGGSPQTFEQVVNQVLGTYSIFTPPNFFCNPYTIDFPKPYGKNPPVMTNYSNEVDSCACNRFHTLKVEAKALGFDTLSRTSMNVFLTANYNDSLSSVLWDGLQRCNELWGDSCWFIHEEADEIPLRQSVQQMSKGGCFPPQIDGFIYLDPGHTQVNLGYTTTSVDCGSCELWLTNVATGFTTIYNVGCGINSTIGFNLPTCDSYRARVVCETVSCGIQVSNIAYLDGCNPCPPPVILSVSYLNTTSFNNVQISYLTNSSYLACNIVATNTTTMATYTFPITCGSGSATLSLPACEEYSFVITSFKKIPCGLKTSDPVVLPACNPSCPDPLLNNVAYINQSSVNNVQVDYSIGAMYTTNYLYVYDVSGNLILTQSISNANTSIVLSLLTCQNYRFNIYAYSPLCGAQYTDTLLLLPLPSCVSCTKPVITSATILLPNPTQYSQNVALNYTVPAGASNCTLKIYNMSGGGTYFYGTQPINCAATSAVVNLPLCFKYRFVIQVDLPIGTYGCDMSISDTAKLDSCWRMFCDTIYRPVPMSDWVIIPPMLNCGYQKPCITCGKLDSLTTEFRQIYPAFNGVPYLDSVTTTDDQAKQNSLWARFLNYRTGFSKNAIDYMKAYNDCHTIVPPPGSAICSFTKPLNDPSDIYPPDTIPCQQVQTQAQFIAAFLYEKMKDSLIAKFDSLYLAKCLGAKYSEEFYVKYKPREFHYTLHSYDLVGNLVMTMPPAAVKPNYDPTYLDNVRTARNNGTTYLNSLHDTLLATKYRYNTLNQVVMRKTPDGGITKFWYDRLGRMVVSQNAKQAAGATYGYTIYDALGRIVEVGEKPQGTLMTQTISQDTTALQNWLVGGGIKQQITRTVYDEAYTPLQVVVNGVSGLFQKNLRNRISYAYVKNAEDQVESWDVATFYSYDMHGNVDTLLQDFKTGMGAITCTNDPGTKGNRFKKMWWDYDLIANKVNEVSYQGGQADQFYHQYIYDAQNKLLQVRTSRDKIYWELDAQYEHYRHGPVNRLVLGQNKVQGLDYAYTIHGWLKGVNSTDFQTPGTGANFDAGQDAVNVGGNPNRYTAKDAYGFSLYYFYNDYKPISVSATPFAIVPQLLPAAVNGVTTGGNLFNGNIRAMAENIAQFGSTKLKGLRYDQLNRFVRMDILSGTFVAGNGVTLTATTDYHEEVTYDPNGNIRTYLRNGSSGQPAMDNFTYQYEKTPGGIVASNKLRYVHDQVAPTNYINEDLDTQTPLNLVGVMADNSMSKPSDNYRYDEIGNLIKDSTEGISNVEWTMYGKVKAITKYNGTVINYTYDATGYRISKVVSKAGTDTATYYVRDSDGKVMSVYTRVSASSTTIVALSQSEIPLYGSDRLGVYNVNVDVQSCIAPIPGAVTYFQRGNKSFELVNHLSNVLATVSDKKIGSSANLIIVDYFIAEVITANDYYPFGMLMPGRKYVAAGGGYRYSINGQEKEKELNENITTALYWEYDSRIGRRWNVDPVLKVFESPFLCFGGNPILGADPDGDNTQVVAGGPDPDPDPKSNIIGIAAHYRFAVYMREISGNSGNWKAEFNILNFGRADLMYYGGPNNLSGQGSVWELKPVTYKKEPQKTMAKVQLAGYVIGANINKEGNLQWSTGTSNGNPKPFEKPTLTLIDPVTRYKFSYWIENPQDGIIYYRADKLKNDPEKEPKPDPVVVTEPQKDPVNDPVYYFPGGRSVPRVRPVPVRPGPAWRLAGGGLSRLGWIGLGIYAGYEFFKFTQNTHQENIKNMSDYEAKCYLDACMMYN